MVIYDARGIWVYLNLRPLPHGPAEPEADAVMTEMTCSALSNNCILSRWHLLPLLILQGKPIYKFMIMANSF